ncbi:triacylglycerol lipase [Dechloromonas sp.]|uniref:esterase/lipase family protein n=1 Tax=Dechloromonas sp. TaxID=1917218 RepID=UPI00121FDF80|nr:alpha/beta fold hydrolase [Dechloromonas sp.]MBU3697585.1 alpha/beta fold hydrolase [Dechloromonas sp.]TEX48131.1 MAG: lipase [Rhodocyclaceae bacterium]
MVPVALMFWLVVEFATYVNLTRYFFGLPIGDALLPALGALLGLRLGIVAITWIFAWAYPSPAPRLTAWRYAGMLIGEYLAFIFGFILVLPFERLWMPADRLQPGRPTVLLVHGYGCSRGVWWFIRRRLEAAGYNVASVSLTPPYTSVGKMVPQLNARIEAVIAAAGVQQLTLVAHSMGGLVCRSYLARHGIARVNRLITLASPHQGSEMARIAIGQNAREMEPGSQWLRDLATDPVKIPVVSVRTPHDNYVMPQDNQRLPEARDVELPGIGHLALLLSSRTAALLIELCGEPLPDPETSIRY